MKMELFILLLQRTVLLNYPAVAFFSNEMFPLMSASFHSQGRVNKQNCRIWGTEPMNQVNKVLQHSPSVMVWCVVSKYEIIGPYFFENENVTLHSNKRMLQYFAFLWLRNYPQNTLLHLDGSPPHYDDFVTQYLNITFPNRWIGTGGQYHG